MSALISGTLAAETILDRRRWPTGSGLAEGAMAYNHRSNGSLGAILGALIAVALALFLLSGGEHFGKKTVNSDADLPPVAQGK
jgi:hypothetical protein